MMVNAETTRHLKPSGHRNQGVALDTDQRAPFTRRRDNPEAHGQRNGGHAAYFILVSGMHVILKNFSHPRKVLKFPTLSIPPQTVQFAHGSSTGFFLQASDSSGPLYAESGELYGDALSLSLPRRPPPG